MTSINPYPMFLSPYFDVKPWGGHHLQEGYHKGAAGDALLGESWELSALVEGQSTIGNGALQGTFLRDVYRQYPALFGRVADPFPLLIKLLDANDWLSVQVHPGDGAQSKCEAWLVLDATPDAQIILGSDLPDGAALSHAARDGDLLDHLHFISANKGDVFLVPPGTLHAIGKGLVIYEIQQPSNVTYRVHSFQSGREVHIDQAAQVYRADAAYGKADPVVVGDGRQLLVRTPYFALERVDASKGITLQSQDYFLALTALGEGSITCKGERYPYQKGDSFLIPVELGDFTLQGGEVLIAYVPNKDQ